MFVFGGIVESNGMREREVKLSISVPMWRFRKSVEVDSSWKISYERTGSHDVLFVLLLEQHVSVKIGSS